MKKLLILALVFPISVSHAQSCAVVSPKHKNTLVELFTSEGCSSCPPADSRLKDIVKNRSADVIPISLHVTYWNYLGWTDTFSKEQFDERQDAYVGATAIHKFPYTPEFFINGAEWREWQSKSALADIVSANAQTDADYTIKLSAQKSGDNHAWTVDVSETETQAGRGPARLFIAVYEDGLSTEVKSGENRDHRLTHDHVVRDWIGPIPISPGNPLRYSHALTLDTTWDSRKMGVIALIQNSDSSIAQAVSLPLCED